MSRDFGSIESILRWFKEAKPNPTHEDQSVQLGVHIEEFVEMIDSLLMCDMYVEFEEQLVSFLNHGLDIARLLKTKESGIVFENLEDFRIDLLDSFMDQLVTVLGCAYMFKFDVTGAASEVDRSNWSKFDDKGKAIFDENGKVAKSQNYTEPSLDSFLLDVVMSLPLQENKQKTTSMENVMNDLIQVSTEASYEELSEARARLEANIQAKQEEAREAAIQRIIDLVNEFDITASQLNKSLAGKIKDGRRGGVRRPAKMKYQNPNDPDQKWSGRGRSPLWIRDTPKDEWDQFLIQEDEKPEAAVTEAPVTQVEHEAEVEVDEVSVLEEETTFPLFDTVA